MNVRVLLPEDKRSTYHKKHPRRSSAIDASHHVDEEAGRKEERIERENSVKYFKEHAPHLPAFLDRPSVSHPNVSRHIKCSSSAIGTHHLKHLSGVIRCLLQ